MFSIQLFFCNMSTPLKRLRQISIFESFSQSKKQRNNNSETNMGDSMEVRGKMLAAAEKRMASMNIVSDSSLNFKSVESIVKVPENISTEKSAIDSESGYENSAELFIEEQFSSEDFSSAQNSAELFPEGDSGSFIADDEEEEDCDESNQLAFLNRTPDCSIPLPKLEPLENHSIMFSPHIRTGDAPRPYPPRYRDKWDSDHVRMPCSPENKYPVNTRTGEKRIESRWDLICRSLRREIESSKDLEDAIMAYNSQYADRWNFLGLHAFINQHFSEAERDYFFENLLPAMIELALNLPTICTQPVSLLKKDKDHYVTLSQKQIGCLLANAFFCTFPRRTLPNRRSKQRYNYEFATYPDINFNRLFFGEKRGIPPRKCEKLQCLINYFRRITTNEPCGTVTFHRQCLPSTELPAWHQSARGIRTAVIKSAGLIESDGHGMLQVDFANKFVGGGVLGHGCVQEEIRFVICPELIVSRLFVESLGPNEALTVTGVEQYNKYSGYSDNFKWEGDFKDQTPRDSWGRRYTQLVAINATSFTNITDQFKPELIRRELNKAYCGFYENALPPNISAIATGNWGCGAFKGNSKLKFLIQLMAASEAGRNMLYFTFGNITLKKELQKMYTFITDKNLSVGDIWRLLSAFSENLHLYSETRCSELYDFIYSQFMKGQLTDNVDDVPLNDSDKRAAEKLLELVKQDDSSTDTEEYVKTS